MRFNKLILILLALFVLYGILVNWTIRGYEQEINRLRTRVDNLEIVVNHDYKLTEPNKPEKHLSANQI